MTIFLALGIFAGLYMIWLLFSLAVYALPVSTGIGVAFSMHGHGYGILLSTLAGCATGIAILIIGRGLFAVVASPAIRLGLALLFAIPAGVAGYHSVHGLGRLVLDPGAFLSILSWVGALAVAAAAWAKLAAFAIDAPQADQLITASRRSPRSSGLVSVREVGTNGGGND